MLKLLLQLLIFDVYGQNLAMIDTGVDIESVNQEKIHFQDYLKCKYSVNTEIMSKCETKDFDYEKHGTSVFNILSKNVPDNTILIYSYASPEHSLKLLQPLNYPMSLRQVYVKKQLLTEQSKSIANAINLAVINKASVINISLGSLHFNSDELMKAISYNPDTLFVFAAGNNGRDTELHYNKMYPCSFKFPNTICIGSLDSKGNIAEYSNYGSDVDLYVKPAGNEEGTSFSAPVIANQAFLLRKKFTMKETIDKLKDKYTHKKASK